ncbi:unnamed protein product [Cylicostephanus goldi]|uniref:Uncharacterized protein n=1 Tax=Cylicostephanus goldi TaxID=71465 RepID=A0A3P7P8L3_CYLGO|nr:unnamed protein product [Cylicostephanus goldi]
MGSRISWEIAPLPVVEATLGEVAEGFKVEERLASVWVAGVVGPVLLEDSVEERGEAVASVAVALSPGSASVTVEEASEPVGVVSASASVVD